MAGHAARLSSEPRQLEPRGKTHRRQRVGREVVAGLAPHAGPDRHRFVDLPRGAAVIAEEVPEASAGVALGARDRDRPLRIPVRERLRAHVRVRRPLPLCQERHGRSSTVHRQAQPHHDGVLALCARVPTGHGDLRFAHAHAAYQALLGHRGDLRSEAREIVSCVVTVSGAGGHGQRLAHRQGMAAAGFDAGPPLLLELGTRARREQRPARGGPSEPDSGSQQSSLQSIHGGAPSPIQRSTAAYRDDVEV
jgi:hypothetical protein